MPREQYLGHRATAELHGSCVLGIFQKTARVALVLITFGGGKHTVGYTGDFRALLVQVEEEQEERQPSPEPVQENANSGYYEAHPVT